MMTCIHPRCRMTLKRGTSLCGRHFARLSDDLRGQWKRSSKMSADALLELTTETEQFFQSRMLGDTEIASCRYCGGDIVWVEGNYGPMPVDVDGCAENERAYNRERHTPHSKTCTGDRNQ